MSWMIRSTFRKLQSKFTHCHLLWLRRRAHSLTAGNFSSPVVVLLREQWWDKSPRYEVNADPLVSAGRWLYYRTELKRFFCNNIISCQVILGELGPQEARMCISRRVSSLINWGSHLSDSSLHNRVRISATIPEVIYTRVCINTRSVCLCV